VFDTVLSALQSSGDTSSAEALTRGTNTSVTASSVASETDPRLSGARVEVDDLHKWFEHGGRTLEVLRGITFML